MPVRTAEVARAHQHGSVPELGDLTLGPTSSVQKQRLPIVPRFRVVRVDGKRATMATHGDHEPASVGTTRCKPMMIIVASVPLGADQ
jgi:hypothetical protein